MSLDKKFKLLESKGEEKKVTLRIKKGKVDLIEKLADHYGTNTSTLIREMIDEAIMKLQLELIVLDEEQGIKHTGQNDKEFNVTYLPDVITLMTPELELRSYGNSDFKNDKEYDNFSIEHNRLSVEHGITENASGNSAISNKKYNFSKK